MILILMATLLSQDPPADAPIIDMVVEAGDIVPFKGYCLEEKEFIKRERINVRNDVIVTEAQKNLLISSPVFVAIILGALATGVGLAFAGIEVKKQLDKGK